MQRVLAPPNLPGPHDFAAVESINAKVADSDTDNKGFHPPRGERRTLALSRYSPLAAENQPPLDTSVTCAGATPISGEHDYVGRVVSYCPPDEEGWWDGRIVSYDDTTVRRA